MLPNVMLFLWLVAGVFSTPIPPAVSPVSVAAPTPPPALDCPYGCIRGGETWQYVLSRSDLTWLAKMAKAESGPRFVVAESSATVWAIIQNFYRVNRRRGTLGQLSLGTFIQNYSAACSKAWATGGSRGFHARITPRADLYRAMKWKDLPVRWRRFATDVFCGRVPNRSPGLVHVLARGFEDSAARELFGPWYATTIHEHPGGNAYYWTEETRTWGPDMVRIVPAAFDPLCDYELL